MKRVACKMKFTIHVPLYTLHDIINTKMSEIVPTGGHHRRYDPKQAKKIKEGGKIAQRIAKETAREHQETEVPKAEEELLDELKKI